MTVPGQPELPREAEVVVVGGGFAGAATACFLGRYGVPRVVLLEAEDQFAVHASGLNAAMARQVTADPLTNEVLRASVALIRRRDGFWPTEVEIRQNGSILLTGPGETALKSAARQAAEAGLDCAIVDRPAVIARVGLLERTDFAEAVLTRSDGVVDIHALLWRYLADAKAHGVQVLSGVRVEAVEVQSGRVRGVVTSAGGIRCPVVVNAAGAWANRLAQSAGVRVLDMQPYRRHLVTTPPLPFVDPSWPFVWDTVHEYYFRPEVRGLLLSPGDQTPAEPARAQRDPAALERLAEVLRLHCPDLARIPVHRWWAGLRTITRDGRFAVGWDRSVGGFFWVAGLGGHGMTASAAVGSFAASLLAGREVPEPWRTALDPARLQ